MDKQFYKQFGNCTFLSVTICLLVCFQACKKNNEITSSGISFGITGVEPLIAGTGDTLKIYGQGFQESNDGNTVKINGVNAKVVSASASILSVIVPIAPRNGVVSVQTGNNTSTYNQNFTVETVITGDQTANTTWTPDKLYLLKAITHFKAGTTLTIQAGTVILADKATSASLIIDDGATAIMNGTAAQPIVFSSNQLQGLRAPGDWTGITLAAATLPGAANDVLKYVRIEYAGFHLPNLPGAALQVTRGTGAGNIQYVQTSYSGGDGFRFNSAIGTAQYVKYLVAFGCAGNDFTFTNGVRAFGQFLLGLKDPYVADQLEADGLLVQSSQPVTISNLTLVGYTCIARNIAPIILSFYYPPVYEDIVVNPNAGRGVHIGGVVNNGGVLQSVGGSLQLFNSLIAAPWLAGISLDGPLAWSQYENGTTGSVIRKTSVTYTLASSGSPIYEVNPYPPYRGYTFSKENVTKPYQGFESVANTIQQSTFAMYNDTARLALAADPNGLVYDNLGITNLALYSKLNHPLMTPLFGSTLLSGADFTSALLSDNSLDKTVVFRGAFGTNDWSKLWANYTPQQTVY